MKFILLIYQGSSPLPETDRWKSMPEAEQKRIYLEYAEFNKTPGLSAGLPMGLPKEARTVQVKDGKAVIRDGTYLPEGVGGYCVLEAETIEAAVAVAAKIPAARLGGAIEIRPADKYW